MKKVLSIALVALFVAGTSAFACDSCGCTAKKEAKKECASADKSCKKDADKKCDADKKACSSKKECSKK
ncbi:hypothetical protein EGM51_07750 [Verrucomicrobia bacterium S94]|nr:hypothetical protein EGM51_07750 [Verrucomicrobia bacterium S94]